MKKILMMLLLAAPVALFAQKFAQVDYFALVQAMPAFKTAQTELETLGKSYEADLAELQAREDNSRNFEQAKQEKLQPLYMAVAEAVKAYAKEGGYVYIIDKQAAQSAYIFLNNDLNEDVTNKVAAKLGVSLAPAAPTRPVVAQ